MDTSGGGRKVCGGVYSGNKVSSFSASEMNCLEKLALPNCQVNYNLISINLFKTIYVENGYCKEK